MIAVTVKMDAVPEKHAELLHTLRELKHLKPEEQGHLHTDASRDVNNENIFNFTEIWKTRQDVEHYLRSHRFSVVLGAIKVLTRSSEVSLLTLSPVSTRFPLSERSMQAGMTD